MKPNSRFWLVQVCLCDIMNHRESYARPTGVGGLAKRGESLEDVSTHVVRRRRVVWSVAWPLGLGGDRHD
jgi:hypothetical protein